MAGNNFRIPYEREPIQRESFYVDEAIEIARRNNGVASIPGPDGKTGLVVCTPQHYDRLVQYGRGTVGAVARPDEKPRKTRKQRKLIAQSRKAGEQHKRERERARRHAQHELNRRRKKGLSIY